MMNNKESQIKRTTLTAKDGAAYLGISYWFLTQLVKRKQIPCIRMGNRILFRLDTLNQYLKEKEEDSIFTEATEDVYGKLRRIKE